MNDRSKIFKVSAIIASLLTVLCLVFNIIISIIKGFTIYPYLVLLIAFISCGGLWKMYVDAKNI
ncbi:hypothetical protein [Clostridium vincentii]|uniref:Uncharacterized protein n=1 Tax=Clostridium vincentii TaxID=52704 RepID=A0A2T0BDB2_9CLOT|nr:hypothetical protein [Clostridium vincentii]PRR81878.1 hypothetical protein CLVI_22240 [Clostridium vincentii]